MDFQLDIKKKKKSKVKYAKGDSPVKNIKEK